MTPEEAERIINPPAPEVSEEQVEIARLKYIIENVLWEAVDDFDTHHRNGTLDDNLASFLVERADFILDNDFQMEQSAETFWKLLCFEYRTAPHAGDCIAVPMTCSRCYIESLMGYNTAPKDKHIGYTAFHILREHNARKVSEMDHTKRPQEES